MDHRNVMRGCYVQEVVRSCCGYKGWFQGESVPLLSSMSMVAPASSSNLIISVLPVKAAWCRAAILQRNVENKINQKLNNKLLNSCDMASL